MTPLRQKMVDAMTVRGFSHRTHQTYLYAIEQLARHFHCSPDQLSPEDVEAYLLYLLRDRQLSHASCRMIFHAIRFLFVTVLKQTSFTVDISFPKSDYKIPELLSPAEVYRIISCADNMKHRTLLMLCYGCGLRVSELVHVEVKHLDFDQMLLHVHQGKGAKDRLIEMSFSLIEQLQHYLAIYRPYRWAFQTRDPINPISIKTAQNIFTKAKNRSGVLKSGGIHSLRHAYATHQLSAGMPLHQLRLMLGHADIRTTERYLHWIPGAASGRRSPDLLAAMEVSHG